MIFLADINVPPIVKWFDILHRKTKISQQPVKANRPGLLLNKSRTEIIRSESAILDKLI